MVVAIGNEKVRLRSEQIKDLYANSIFAVLASMVLGAILCFVLWPNISHPKAVVWMCVNAAAVGIHLYFYRKYQNAPPDRRDPAVWSRIVTVTFALRALAFGSAGILLFSHDTLTLAILLVTLAGLISGVVSSYHMMKHVANTFTVCFLLPLIYSLVTSHIGGHTVLAVTCLLYMPSMVVIAGKLNRIYTHNVMLRIENEKFTGEWVSTFDSVEDMIFVLDGEHRIVKANRHACERLGMNKPEIVGKHCHEVMHCSDSPVQGCPHTRMLSDGMSHSFELFEKGLNGYSKVSVYPTHDSEGRLTGSVHVVSDITAVKAAEREKDLIARQYRELVESASAIHWEYSAAEGRFTYVSPQAEAILGYPVSRWTDLESWASMIHEDDRQWAREFSATHVERCENHEFSYRAVAAVGKLIHVRNIVVVHCDGGRPVRMRGIMIDETQSVEIREKLSASLAEQQALLKELKVLELAVGVTQVGVTICDMDRRIIYVNQADADMHGYKVQELLGLNAGSVYAVQGGGGDIGISELKDGWVRESVNKRKDGSEFPVLLSSVVMRDAKGDPMGLVTSCEDITFLKNRELALKNALDQREMLIKEIHHRVKNNLAVIQSLLSLQSSRTSDSAAQSALGESMGRVRAMAMIHERLYKTTDLSTIDFSEYMTSLATGIFGGYRTGDGNVKLRLDIPRIHVDVDTIIPCALIVNELVTNALKYAFPGGRAGELFVGIEYDADNLPNLVVRDNGVGMPEGVEPGGGDSMGMKIVRALSSQIGAGKAALKTGPTGTEFRVPLKRYHLNPVIWEDTVHLVDAPVLDEQHRRLYEQMGKLRSAIESGGDAGGIIAALLIAAKEHFEAEELLMERFDYPDRESHAEIHRQQAARLNACVGKSGPASAREVFEALHGWLAEHIGDEDRALGRFLKERGAAAAASVPTERPAPAASRDILLIEDDRLTQMSMGRLLSKLGYTFDMAAGGREALESVKGCGYGLIVSDFNLQDMDGAQIARAIKDTGLHAPILFLTGMEPEEIGRAVEGINVAGVVFKPVSFVELERALAGIFKRQRRHSGS